MTDYMWVVAPEDNTEFWMAAYKKQYDAIKLCEAMGWKYHLHFELEAKL